MFNYVNGYLVGGEIYHCLYVAYNLLGASFSVIVPLASVFHSVKNYGLEKGFASFPKTYWINGKT